MAQAEHDHSFPEKWEDVLPCIKSLYRMATGEEQVDWIDAVAHVTELIQFALKLLKADERIVIGVDPNEEEQLAINQCLSVCPAFGQPKEGPITNWAIKLILKQLVDQLMEFLAALRKNQDVATAYSRLGDGTILKILLENLPAILELIFKLINSKED